MDTYFCTLPSIPISHPQAMYLGVVANPISSQNFDGKIFLQRVSKTEQYKQKSHCQNFSDDAQCNAFIKSGAWYDDVAGYVVDGTTLLDVKQAIATNYGVDSAVLDRLVLRQQIGRGKKKKYRYIVEDDEEIPPQDELKSGKYKLMVRYKKGDVREVDTTCDSQFIQKIMPQVGRAIRNAYNWVPFSVTIYCILTMQVVMGRRRSSNSMCHTFATFGTLFALTSDLGRRGQICWT